MSKRIILGTLIALCAAFPASAEVIYVNAENGLNVRQKPTEDSASTQVLAFGQRVVVIDDDPDLNGWYRVEGGGYVNGKHTQKTDPFDDMELLGSWRVTAMLKGTKVGLCRISQKKGLSGQNRLGVLTVRQCMRGVNLRLQMRRNFLKVTYMTGGCFDGR